MGQSNFDQFKQSALIASFQPEVLESRLTWMSMKHPCESGCRLPMPRHDEICIFIVCGEHFVDPRAGFKPAPTFQPHLDNLFCREILKKPLFF